MALNLRHHPELARLLGQRDGVVLSSEVSPYLSRGTLRWQVTSGRWQQPCHGVVVAQSGPLAERPVHVLVPGSRAVRKPRLAWPVVVHYSRLLGVDDVQPLRQPPRRDAAGRRRWLDAVWEDARLIVEVDGRHHENAEQYWADMNRDNGFILDGYRVLRFPAFVVRYRPGYVAAQIRGALRLAARQAARQAPVLRRTG